VCLFEICCPFGPNKGEGGSVCGCLDGDRECGGKVMLSVLMSFSIFPLHCSMYLHIHYSGAFAV
jgi:hypothetical protein